MAKTEFDLIDTFFTQQQVQRADVNLNIGDDCALTSVLSGKFLATTTDTMVENSHFYPNIDPRDLGYKAIATNLSDLAAMGAEPAWVSLALTLPKSDENWLHAFSQGMFELLNEHHVALIGGDTTSGTVPSITITAQGFVEKNTALRRDQAKVGDWIYVSGTLGDGLAGFYLISDLYQGKKSAVNFDEEWLIQRNFRPTPRISLGITLAKYQLSHCALDLSDGLVGDLGHILQRSGVSAVLNLQDLPCSAALVNLYGRQQAEQFALQGGEDYELCFTVPNHKKALLDQYLAPLKVPYTCIGRIVEKNPQQNIIYQRQGKMVDLQISSFEHFK
ncbi:thiamine-phosphate kinase [Lonepinella koalarum]|uniref:Thiamine-monophosphate kinase n=1 Tax=Lonepinella koalarum TaxID=53417 RepID=A0A4R1KY83_9PAST|nr:thiamine-phosphate kinase [Lonepinella koalarum]MDH2926913.1 thiamine-monophosphate kinase [Lonepinella koalarum]TCK70428.1 thiamine-phosphate kinase [Lonepinella koalarum]TFJ90183.1 thiamine-phosphate kinase [Lonepinella koalarum]